MAIMKSVQIMSESPKSFEQAIKNRITRFSKSFKDIKSVYVNDQSATVGADGDVDMFRVNMQVTFEVKD